MRKYSKVVKHLHNLASFPHESSYEVTEVCDTIHRMNYPRCILKKGKEKPVLGFHPWIFSGAIESVDEALGAGDLTSVESSSGDFLGIGYFNPKSQITVRMLAFEKTDIDLVFFEKKIDQAVALRKSRILNSDTNACRLINSEGDFLPGLVVDLYHDVLVVQFLTAGIEKQKEIILPAIEKHFSLRAVYEKAETKEREIEGLTKENQVLAGEMPGTETEILENGLRFRINWSTAQKTGFFLDQRDNRSIIRHIAKGRKVLDCFCYSGGFSVAAAAGHAKEIMSVDISEHATKAAEENMQLNFPGIPHLIEKRDVFEFLREDAFEPDLIILDPPAFCKNKSQIQQAARGYKDINLAAMKKIAPGGFLYTASCSSFIDPDLFQKIIFGAAKDAKREVKILTKTGNALDHPVSIYHPEGEYLKGLLLQVS